MIHKSSSVDHFKNMNVINTFLSIVIKAKYNQLRRMLKDPIGHQENILQYLIKNGRDTLFGQKHSFARITDYETYKQMVPVRNYDQLSPYIDKIIAGEKNILWKGTPLFLGRSSGSTSNPKIIPVSKESLRNQLNASQYSGLNYSNKYAEISYLRGKILMFSDGHFFEKTGKLKIGSISSIVFSKIPQIYSSLCLPSKSVNSIFNYEERMKAMVDETIGKDIRAIAAMPIWLLVYLRTLKKITGKNFNDHFPNFKLLFLSGMNYEPYMPEIKKYITCPFDILDTYPSTEGFIAYQDILEEKGMQLVLNKGIFYEFIPIDDLGRNNQRRISLKDVETGIDYALILNTDAGLWGYINGDTVRFKTTFPHRIEITGRVSQYISAFGEHLTVEQADRSLLEAVREFDATLVDYTVAPKIKIDGSIPYHEWFIEFGQQPQNLDEFSKLLDYKICENNIYYADLINKKVIGPLKVQVIRPNGFMDFLIYTGRTGMQQKITHLSNTNLISAQLEQMELTLTNNRT